jgi:methylmalonyl-CoA decarboxylase
MNMVTLTANGNIGTITLNNPAKRNALSEALIRGVITGLRDLTEAGARVIILRAEPGVKVWSAGHDIDELPEGRRDPLGWGDALRELVRAIESCPAPVMALVEGGVWGGAVEVVLACDIVIAAPNATFAITPAKLGVPYNVSGMMTFMTASTLRIVKELAFTAQPIAAERAERVGMINHLQPFDQIEAFSLSMAQTIAANAPLSIMSMKEELRVLEGAKPVSPRGFEKVQGMRRMVYDSHDYAEGLLAFKEKRKPVFIGK